MTVLMRADVPGMTSAQFDVVFKPLIDQLKLFPGFITHASGPVGGTLGERGLRADDAAGWFDRSARNPVSAPRPLLHPLRAIEGRAISMDALSIRAERKREAWLTIPAVSLV
jgi:hypothetical protein